jgi:hypothetical protein
MASIRELLKHVANVLLDCLTAVDMPLDNGDHIESGLTRDTLIRDEDDLLDGSEPKDSLNGTFYLVLLSSNFIRLIAPLKITLRSIDHLNQGEQTVESLFS